MELSANFSIMKELLADKKAAKPLQEKFRRERINRSLEEMKSLMLGALYENVTMGRVEVLQMAVKYLRHQRRIRRAASNTGTKTSKSQDTATDFTPPQVEFLNLRRLAPEGTPKIKHENHHPHTPPRACCVAPNSMRPARSINHTKLYTRRPLQEINQPHAEISPLIWQPWR